MLRQDDWYHEFGKKLHTELVQDAGYQLWIILSLHREVIGEGGHDCVRWRAQAKEQEK